MEIHKKRMEKVWKVLYVFIFMLTFLVGMAGNGDFEYGVIGEGIVAEEVADAKPGEALPLDVGEVVDINSDDAGELERLPGIGENLAGRIIKYRTENGNFEIIEDILKVPGIGEKKFEALKEYIIVD